MGFTPPNNSFHAGSPGHSSTPVTPIEGRGSMPTGDRFHLPDAKMPQPQSAVEPGRGVVPVAPFQPGSGLPQRVDVSIPDMAGIMRPGMKPAR